MHRTLWIVLVPLVALGLFASWGRATHLKSFATEMDPVRTRILAAYGLSEPNPAARAATVARLDRGYGEHPVPILLHVVLGGVFLLLAPLQLSRTIRARFLAYHRWQGRVLIALGLVIGATAFFFGVLMPFAGPGEGVAIAIFDSVFVFALARAFVAIRRKDIATHREWMLRAFAAAIAISTVRVAAAIADPLFTPLGYSAETVFVISVWAGWLLTVGVAELWLVRTRQQL